VETFIRLAERFREDIMPHVPHSSPPGATATTSGKENFRDLPEWNLDDLYIGENAPELARDMGWLDGACEKFAGNYEGKLAKLDATGFLKCIEDHEAIDRISGRIMSFAGLRYAQNTTDAGRARFLQNCEERITVMTRRLVFFELEVNRLDGDFLADLFARDPRLARYAPVFERIRAMKPHRLSDELEQFLHDRSSAGASAWNKLFDETIAGLTFRIGDEELNLESTLDAMTGHDRPRREAAARELARVLAANIKLFSRVHNTLAKAKEIEDRWRKLPTPQMSRHLKNHVEPEVVEALRNAVVASYPAISHRYYALKAKWLGLDKLRVWDRNAPLPMEDDRRAGWEEAKQTVMEAYAGFDPEMARIAEPFFERGWVDAGVKPGKAPGAFCHPTVTDAHPYVMLNYLGRPRDVMTLAHELGHGVHQVLAADQGEFLSATPLTLAETASVFGEMLTFRRLLDSAETPEQRKVLLAGKVEDAINTVVRQISFYDFECRLHAARREGELIPEAIAAIWRDIQKESLGPAFGHDEELDVFWAYIPHFIHTPFYVYAYAFGSGLVNALYAVYEESEAGFREKYFDMLRAGGSRHHKELLAPFGLDASDPGFWDKGLNMISAMIDELEAMS